MSTTNTLQAIAAGTAILAALVAGGGWVIRHYLSELRPNHGSSLNDIVKLQVLPILKKLDASQDEIKHEQTEMKVDIARLEGLFDQYVVENKE